MRQLELSEFSDAIGEDFDLRLEGSSLPLRLVEAQPLSLSLVREGAFRLEWIGPPQPVLDQAIYRLSRGGEDYDIFIVPISADRQGTRYEAVFN